MNIKNLIAGMLLLNLSACQNIAPPILSRVAEWPELRAMSLEREKAGPVYTLDAAASKVNIYVFRGGTAAKLGHNHVLSVAQFEGYVSVPTEQATDAGFELRVPLEKLVVDDPVLRAATSGNFSSPRSESDIEGTRKNMLGEKGFDVERFPLMRLRSIAIEGDWPILVAQVEITLHGVTQVKSVMLEVDKNKNQLKVTGMLQLRQSDFGITPFSILGGLIAVQDVVAINFELVAKQKQ